MLWFAGFVVAATLVGFFLAALGFFVVFLHYKTETRWPRALGLTAAAIALLLGLGWMLTSDFPGGLLQAYAACHGRCANRARQHGACDNDHAAAPRRLYSASRDSF